MVGIARNRYLEIRMALGNVSTVEAQNLSISLGHLATFEPTGVGVWSTFIGYT